MGDKPTEDLFAEAISEATTVDGGTVRGVLLCGLKSRNGYAFTTESLQAATGGYVGKSVFLDHVKGYTDRQIRDLAGVVTTSRFESSRGIVGDVDTEGYPAGELFQKLAKKRTREVGMSHVAAYEYDSSRKLVTRIKEVLQVDLVIRPATTNNMYEHQNLNTNGRQHMEITAEALLKEKADGLEKKLAESQSAVATATAKVTALEADVTKLKQENEKLSAEKVELVKKVDNYELKAKLIKQRDDAYAEVKEAFKEELASNKLTMETSTVLAKAFLESLASVESKEARATLIADRKAVWAEAIKGSGGAVSSERSNSDNKSFSAEEALKSNTLFR